MKYILILLLIVACLPFHASHIIAAEREQNPYQSGMAYMRSGRYDKAVVELEKARRITPDNTGVLYQLGMAYYNQEKITEAIAMWKKAAGALDDKNMMKTTLLDIIERAKVRKKTIEKIRAVEELERKGGKIPLDKGLEAAALYQKEKRHAKALEMYDRLVKAYPDDARALAKIAAIYYTGGRILWAERQCLLALDRDKENAECKKLLAGIREEVEALRRFGYDEMIKGAHK